MRARLFLDSSVWLAGLGSPLGGAGWLLFLMEAGEIEVISSEQILVEVRRNLEDKKVRYASRLETILKHRKPRTLPEFKDTELLRWLYLVPPKDCHVLAGAFKSEADALITLDKEHILTPTVKAAFPLPIMTPGEFLEAFHLETEREDNLRRRKGS
ncbi:MAG TPA: PIN domain-containing protein [Candidatus Ozemobacteraceae bacterium]|nr:PIN domain-containing protein [Candidatus Ozemobacteraceae bacterium]